MTNLGWLLATSAVALSPYSPLTGTWYAPPTVPDGAGGFVKVWVRYFPPVGSLSTQGPAFWTTGGQSEGFGAWSGNGGSGVSLSVTMGSPPFGQPTPTPAAGLPVSDYRMWRSQLYAQRVDAKGNEVWTNNGKMLATSFGLIEPPAVVPDELGNTIVVWSQLNADYDLYAQKISAAGEPLWEKPAVGVAVMVREQRFPQAVADGKGGVFVGWQDSRRGDIDVYVQHLDDKGKESWPRGGVPLTGPRDQYLVAMTADMKGGVWLTWYEPRFQESYETFSLHLDEKGRATSDAPHWWRGE